MSAPAEFDFSRAVFLGSAPDLQRCPPDTGAEIALAGRSNAGKSSLLNRLTGQSKLARTSKTPGRTRLLNFFALGAEHRLVDLPGYGFARVPLAVRREWERHLSEYLHGRRSLCGCVLLMDIRHPLQASDRHFVGWAVARGLRLHLVLTKADKLGRGAAQAAVLRVRREVVREFAGRDLGGAGEGAVATVQGCSALKGEGVAELRGVLGGWFLGSGG
ncbi:MAG: YihA family ribosome biogenesis GTP-binding protein [Cellvibrionales bacterium]|nr:YihA family ribosome biogenesis GTP-binding protein [Cellvibrionales bacterium]